MTDPNTAEAIARIRQALEAGPTGTIPAEAITVEECEANRAFSAACSPDAVRSLLSKLEAAEARVEQQEETMEKLRLDAISAFTMRNAITQALKILDAATTKEV